MKAFLRKHSDGASPRLDGLLEVDYFPGWRLTIGDEPVSQDIEG